MRTTVTLPADLHHTVSSIARDRRQTVSKTIEDLLRRALQAPPGSGRLEISPVTGLLTVRLDGTITEEDVRSLEDDE